MTRRSKNLLLCFDAFGTLIRPKQPVLKQYAAVAEQCGLKGLDISQLKDSFSAAYKAESVKHPNFGRASDLGAQRWWTNVITSTFLPFLPAGQEQLPPNLAPKLLHRFSSGEGYDLTEPKLVELLRRVKRFDRGRNTATTTTTTTTTTLVGVVTNSDDRIPEILKSLGLRVSPARYHQRTRRTLEEEGGGGGGGEEGGGTSHDVDFHCMSYDVGVAKPSPVIFGAAVEMALEISRVKEEQGEWAKVYVGDEVGNDLLGAAKAGWHSILIVDEDTVREKGEGVDSLGNKIPEGLVDLDSLDDDDGGNLKLEDVFPPNGLGGRGKGEEGRMMRAGSLKAVLEWFGRH